MQSNDVDIFIVINTSDGQKIAVTLDNATKSMVKSFQAIETNRVYVLPDVFTNVPL